MTRINAGIPPKQLKGKHLLAEHREIKRIPNMILSGRANINQKIPKEFTLGKGHVTFFYNKVYYLFKRYQQVYVECRKRGYNVQDYTLTFLRVQKEFPYLWGNWKPTTEHNEMVLRRIRENELAAKREANGH